MVTGAALVLPAATFDPLATCRRSTRSGPPRSMACPTMFIAELEHPEFRASISSSLRTGVMAGAPCPDRSDEAGGRPRCTAREMTIVYGQTEARR